MSFSTAIVIIVIVLIGVAIYGTRLNANAEKSQEFIKNLDQRVSRLEDRIANLETIVLEKEKTKKYENL